MARATQIIAAVSGRIQTGDGLDTPENTNDDNQQVWAFFGDSLIAGTSAQPDTGQDTEPDYTGTCYDFNGSTIVEITTTGLSNTTTGSPWTKFGQTIYELAQKKVVVCNAASGGSTFYDNNSANSWWSSIGTLRAAAVTKVTNALAAAATTELRGIIVGTWVNDVRASGTIDNSEMLLGVQSFFNWLETTWPGIPVFVVKTGRTESITTLTGRLATMHGYLDAEIAARSNVHEFDNLLNYLPMFANDTLHLTEWGNELFATKGTYNLLNAGLITSDPLVRTYDANSIAIHNRFTGLTNWEKDKIHDFEQYRVRKSFVSLSHFYFGLFGSKAKAAQDWYSSSAMTIPDGSWTDGEGYDLPGTTVGAINTNIVPSSDATFGNISSGVGIWMNNIVSSGVQATIFGASNGAGTQTIQFNFTTGGSEFCVNAGTATAYTALGSKQWFHLNRNLNATHSIVRYNLPANGNITLVGKPTVSIYVGAYNNNGVLQTPAEFSAWLISMGNGSASGNLQGKFRGLIADFLCKFEYF